MLTPSACARLPAGTPWPPATGVCQAWGRCGPACLRCGGVGRGGVWWLGELMWAEAQPPAALLPAGWLGLGGPRPAGPSKPCQPGPLLCFTYTASISHSPALAVLLGCDSILRCGFCHSALPSNHPTTHPPNSSHAPIRAPFQVLNRLTYASTLSHLRRINSPIGREGKLAKPRQLHNSQWGMICPAGERARGTRHSRARHSTAKCSAAQHALLAGSRAPFGAQRRALPCLTQLTAAHGSTRGSSWMSAAEGGAGLTA